MGKCFYLRKGDVHTAPSNLPSIGTALNDMTWEQVQAISEAGLASTYFAVGDIKSIVINGTVGATTFSNLSIDAFILGIDHNAELEGTNKIHFGLGKIGGVDVAFCEIDYGASSGSFCINTSNTNRGGWAACHMRKNILGSDSDPTSPTANTLLAALPSDLRAAMTPITKYTDNTGDGADTISAVTATEDYLPLLAEFEVNGAHTYANDYEKDSQKQYDYYAAGNATKKYMHNGVTSSANWWVRSPYGNTVAQSCMITHAGANYYSSPSLSRGVAPVFAVGGSIESGGESDRMITFTITDAFTSNAVEHQAKAGMTWGEWVQSEYNTDGHTVDSDNSITGADGYYFVMLGSAYVYASDTIQENGAYRAT